MNNFRGLASKTGFVRRFLATECKEVKPWATLNDLSSPEGSWKTKNDARQRLYNMQFVGGIGFLISTLAFGYFTENFDFYNDVPEEPLEIDNYKDV